MNRIAGRNIYIVKLADVVRASGGVDAFVARCTQSRFRAIWIRLGYGPRLDPNLGLPDFGAIQNRLRANNIEIWGWHLPRCPNLNRAIQEAALVVEWANRYQLDGVLLDAESGNRYFQGGAAEAERYAGDVYRGISALGKGVALSSHDQPRNFPGFPFAEFLRHVEDNSPQVYHKRDVATRLEASIRQYRALEAGRDFQDRYKPVGNITVRGDVALPNAQTCVEAAREFMRLVARNGFLAYSFWCWDEAPAEIWDLFRAPDEFAGAEVLMARAAMPPTGMGDAEFGNLAGDVQVLRSLSEGQRSEFYDDVLAPQIEEFSLRVQENTDVANVSRWLQLQSATLDFAVEGIADVTFELWQHHGEGFRAAMATLPAEQRARIEWLLREFAGEEVLPASVMELRISRFAEGVSPGQNGVFGQFIGESTFTSARGFPVVHGTLTLFDDNGAAAGRYTVNSGGGARNHRARNGPTPPGIFRVSNHRPNRTTEGMVLNGVGYSFDLDATDGTPVYGRTLFRIHPDGGSPQTNGCLGIREGASVLREAESMIVDTMRRHGGSFKVSVSHNT
jgi:hypothetical protein